VDYRDRIIWKIADAECERVSRGVIRALQRITNAMLSGDDSGLRNSWDEICVQAQGQESVDWETYLQTMEASIALRVEELSDPIKQVIWLQTNDGMDWEPENEDDTPPYIVEDITDYILHKFVFSGAADWTNARIKQYLAPEYLPG
jgi:hypothetical protein